MRAFVLYRRQLNCTTAVFRSPSASFPCDSRSVQQPRNDRLPCLSGRPRQVPLQVAPDLVDEHCQALSDLVSIHLTYLTLNTISGFGIVRFEERKLRKQPTTTVTTTFTMLTPVLLLVLLAGFSVAVRVSEDTPLDPRTPPPEAKFCVSLSRGDDYACSSDPMEIRSKVDAIPIVISEENSLGMDQRIDGTESEQKAIKEVLKLMNLYWHEEVLSNRDYERVRASW